MLDAKGIKDAIIGAMSHMCIDATSRAAADLGYNTVIIHKACATTDLEFNGVAIPQPKFIPPSCRTSDYVR
jgi:nicotinamidase-related amidase